MAATLQITDGTTTLTFSTGDMYVKEYTPAVALDIKSPIKERAVIGFSKDIATIRSNVQTANRLFYQAASHQRSRSGKKVYVEFDPDGLGTVYRSLLYEGVAHPPEDLLGEMWGGANIEFEMEWTRQPYWEGPLTQVPLTNNSGSDTDGRTVMNSPDADDWVSISSTDVEGDLPAAIKLEMVNNLTEGTATNEFFVFHNVHSNPAGFVHYIEAETTTDSHSTSTTDAGASAGNYAALAWTDNNITTKIAQWSFSSSDMSDAAGGRFALLVRWLGAFPYNDCWIRFKLETADGFEMWTGNFTLVSSTTDGRELSLMDVLRLPPYLEGQSSLKAIDLTMHGKRPNDVNALGLDYVLLAPISGDGGWLRFYSIAGGVYPTETFVHDGIENITYRYDTGGKVVGEFSQYGGPLLLFPNADQKLYFATCDYSGTADIAQGWTVKLWYRPRRLSI